MSRTRRRAAFLGLVITSAFASLVLAAQHSAGGDPLAGLEIDEKGVGWDGILIGMSLVQAERRFGDTLPLTEIPSAQCGRFVSSADRNGLGVRVGFPAAKPGAKIETLYVRFEGYQVVATIADLVASLKAKQPQVRYLPDPASPSLTEADDPAPVYELPARTPLALALRPGDGLLIGPPSCVR